MTDDSHLKHSSIEKWTPQGQHGLTFVLPVQYTEVNEAIDITVRYIKMFHCILSALSNRAKLNQQWSPVVSTQGTAWWYLTWQTAHFNNTYTPSSHKSTPSQAVRYTIICNWGVVWWDDCCVSTVISCRRVCMQVQNHCCIWAHWQKAPALNVMV